MENSIAFWSLVRGYRIFFIAYWSNLVHDYHSIRLFDDINI